MAVGEQIEQWCLQQEEAYSNPVSCLFKRNFFLLYFKSEGWWLFNKKVSNNYYSPSPMHFGFFSFMFKPNTFYCSGGVIDTVEQEIIGSNLGRCMINFCFHRNCAKIPKLSAINHTKMCQEISLSITMSVQHSVNHYEKRRPTF